MPANPRPSRRTYVQGVSLRIDFKDCASVFRAGVRTCVPAGCFSDVLITDEFSPLDPEGGHQRKYNAPGVGVIRVGAAGGVDPETLRLTSVARLCGSALAKVRALAVKQDRRSYSVAPGVMGSAPPAKHTLRAGC